MPTGSTSAYVGACRKDIPYPSVSHESVPSLIDNLVTALYGTITKTVVNRRVVWNIPCDPNNTATINGMPRNAGEGLLCYMIRTSPQGPYFGNANTWTASATLPINYSAASMGPIIINNGVTITIPNSTTYTIL